MRFFDHVGWVPRRGEVIETAVADVHLSRRGTIQAQYCKGKVPSASQITHTQVINLLTIVLFFHHVIFDCLVRSRKEVGKSVGGRRRRKFGFRA